MSKWTRVMALMLAAAVTILAGCGGGQTQAPPADPGQPTAAPSDSTPQPEPLTLEVWIMPNSSKPDQDLLAVVKPFTDANPHITLNVTVLDWGSAWTKITTAATSGEGPDVMQLGTTWVPAIAAMGALEPLKEQVSEVGGAGAFYPASWNTTGIAGEDEVYALPWFIDARAAFYRTDVFAKAGVDPNQAFQDWDSFKAALQQINGTEIEGKPVAAIGFPGKNDWNVAHNIFPWIWAAGGAELSADLTRSAVNGPEAVDALMFYTGLAREGLAPTTVLEKNTAEVEGLFAQGDFAVFFSGPWLIRNFAIPAADGGMGDSITAKNFAVAPIPAGPQGRFTFFGGSNLSVTEFSEHKAEAWELVKFLVSEPGQVEYAKRSGMLPALKAAEGAMKAHSPHFAAFYEAARYGRSYPAIPAWGPLESVLVKHMGTIWDVTAGVSGTYSREEIQKNLDNAAKEIDNLLKQSQ